MPKRSDSGLKKRTMPQEGQFNGQTAPLWMNPKPNFFLTIFYQAFGQLFVFQLANVVYFQSYVKNMPFVCITSLLVYGLLSLRIFHIKYATDVEWFFVFIRFGIVTIISLIFESIVLIFLSLNYFYSQPPGQNTAAPACTGSEIFTSPLAMFVLINLSGVIIIQIQLIFFFLFLYVQLYLINTDSKFYYKQTRQVMLLD